MKFKDLIKEEKKVLKEENLQFFSSNKIGDEKVTIAVEIPFELYMKSYKDRTINDISDYVVFDLNFNIDKIESQITEKLGFELYKRLNKHIL